MARSDSWLNRLDSRLGLESAEARRDFWRGRGRGRGRGSSGQNGHARHSALTRQTWQNPPAPARTRAAPKRAARARATSKRAAAPQPRGAKRKAAEVIDLTNDDEEEPAAQARSAPRPHLSSQSSSRSADFIPLSQGLPSTQAELDEETNAAAIADNSQELDDSVYTSYELYG